MSLDITLTAMAPTEVYQGNITHNLATMAAAAGLYEALWSPEDIDVTLAGQLIVRLDAGLYRLKRCPEEYKKYSPENGWGCYDQLVDFVEAYLEACKAYPRARVSVSK